MADLTDHDAKVALDGRGEGGGRLVGRIVCGNHAPPVLHELIAREHRRQAETLTMVAAPSIADPTVLACQGSTLLNTTTEEHPGARFHAECEVVDPLERLAVERARRAFGTRFANVQPHTRGPRPTRS